MTAYWNDPLLRQKMFYYMGAALLMAVLLLWPHNAWASDTTGGLPYESFLTKVRTSMTGTVGYTFALVGIVVAGAVLVLGGDLNGFVRSLMLLVMVVALLVAANSVLASISGGGATVAFNAPVGHLVGVA